MAQELIGPFIVTNATTAQKADVRAVVSKMPASMRVANRWINLDFGQRPDSVPNWALGYRLSNTNVWVKGNQSSSDRQYVIAHEFWHSWSGINPNTEAQVRQLVVGPRGNVQNSSWTNDPNEGEADAFAKALGFRTPFPNYDFKAYIPASSYSYFITILNNLDTPSAPLPPPPVGTGAVVNSNADKIIAFLTWWHGVGAPDHDFLSTWNQILERFEIDTNNKPASDFIRSRLIAANIPLDVALNLYSVGSTERFINGLTEEVPSGTPGFGLFDGLFAGIGEFTSHISHAFFFLIIIIIGIAILFLGAKSRPATSGAT